MPECEHLKLPLKENIPQKDLDCVQNICRAENITKHSLNETETPILVCVPLDQVKNEIVSESGCILCRPGSVCNVNTDMHPGSHFRLPSELP